jgi:hypothetical protein
MGVSVLRAGGGDAAGFDVRAAARVCRSVARRLALVVVLLGGTVLVLATAASADIYWSNGDYIGHASSAGGNVNPTFINTGEGLSVGSLVVAGGYIYFADGQYDGDIGRVAVNGSGLDTDFITTGGTTSTAWP